jgi:hypothetical protein
MWPALVHQKPGKALVVFVVPVIDPGRGCSGERASMCAQAAVPGSSEPSGQSHELSLTWDDSSVMEGLLMHVKVDLPV